MMIEEDLVALPAPAAAQLAGISDRRLQSWEARGLTTPSVNRQLSERNTVRLYNFRDLLALLVVHELLQQGARPRTIARLVDHLQSEYARPLTSLRWAVQGKRVYVQHMDETWVGDKWPTQVVTHQVLDLVPLKSLIWETVQEGRAQEDVGRTERRRRVMGSKEVFAGTRVPVEAVRSYLRRGHGDDRILQAFPQLRPEDVVAARQTA